jgi:hypothetical protein
VLGITQDWHIPFVVPPTSRTTVHQYSTKDTRSGCWSIQNNAPADSSGLHRTVSLVLLVIPFVCDKCHRSESVCCSYLSGTDRCSTFKIRGRDQQVASDGDNNVLLIRVMCFFITFSHHSRVKEGACMVSTESSKERGRDSPRTLT